MKKYWEKGTLVWVAPGSVTFNRDEIDLLLPWLDDMREGAYPAEPASGYADGKRKGNTRAHYAAACEVAAELNHRLARCGLDRYLVEDCVCRGLLPSDLSRKLGLPEWEINRRIRSVISYIASGPCPRWLDCIDCPDYGKCRNRAHPPRKFEKQPVGVSYRGWVRSRSRPHTAERR